MSKLQVARELRIEALDSAVIERQHLMFRGLEQEEKLQLLERAPPHSTQIRPTVP